MNKEKEIANRLIDYYKIHGRDLPWRHNRNPYRVWISEIMLQQTRVEAVKGYYARFLQELPDIQALANVDDDLLMKLWEGLGYYTRARNLKKCAIECCEKYSGEMPTTSVELEQLPGIGRYTAAAIASFCYGESIAALDGNGLRVFARLYGIEDNVLSVAGDKKIRNLMQECVGYVSSSSFNQAVMDLASSICLPKGSARCEMCPLKDLCFAYINNKTGDLPVRISKQKKTEEEYTVLVYVCDNEISIVKRPSSGLLANLYGFEMISGHKNKEEVMFYYKEYCNNKEDIKELGHFKHVFSHKIWKMKAFMIQCNYKINNYIWVSCEELINQYALPTAFAEIAHTVIIQLNGGGLNEQGNCK